MNLGAMRTSLRTRIGSPSVADVPDANLNGHINDAYQEIFNKYKFKRRRARARFTTVIGADKYDLSTLTDIVYKVWDRTNGKELTFVGTNVLSERDYDASPNALVQNARPEQYAHVETYLQILPPPDGLYVIELVYRVLFTTLVNDSDLPIIPANWHRGIVILAAHHHFDDEGGDVAKATYHGGAFDKWVADQPVEEHEETEAIDTGVEVPTLGQQLAPNRKPDGVWWDILP
jgi:hypothetical protein